MTRAPFYPPADRHTQWFSGQLVPLHTTNRLVVWHTTEAGWAWPTYTYDGEAGGSAPHFTAMPDVQRKRIIWRQHWRADESSRALRHPLGTPETNNSGVIQVELAGTAVPGDIGYQWHAADDWALAALAAFSVWARDEWGIPLTDQGRRWSGLRRLTPTAIEQTGGPVRLSWEGWAAARGHAGHEHVPGNDHIDPGALDVRRLFAIATGDDMPTLQEISDLIDARLAAERPRTVSAVLGQLLGHSGPTVGAALQSGFVAASSAAVDAAAIRAKLGA